MLVEAAADAAGRAIDDEHYGAMVFYARTEIPEPYKSGVGRGSASIRPT